MSAKSLYTDTVEKIKEQLRLSGDIEAIQKLDKDLEEYRRYSGNWERVNLDEFIATLQISNDTFNMAHSKRKISFWSDGRAYEVVAAVGASYFRIIRKAFTDSQGIYHGDSYVTLDLTPPHVSGSLRGKDAKAEFNRLTHFRMTHRKGRK